MKKELTVIQNNNCCPTPPEIKLERSQAENGAALLASIADPTRLSIVNMLAGSSEAVCVCDITDSFTLGQPTISHHLRILREAGLITGDKRGKWVYYSIVPSKLLEIQNLLEKAFALPVLV